MREIKTFFTEGNRLNKGYTADIESLDEDENNILRKKIAYNLPSAELMSAYEETHPGTFKKMLKAVEKEQSHRHHSELVNTQMHARASAMGRLFGFFVVCAIGYVTLQLSMNDMMIPGLIFAALGFSSIFGIGWIAYFRTSNRPPYQDRKRHNDRRHSSATAKVQANVAKNQESKEVKEVTDANKPRHGQVRRRR